MKPGSNYIVSNYVPCQINLILGTYIVHKMSAHYLFVECNIELNSLHDMVRWELRLDKSTSVGLVANKFTQ